MLKQQWMESDENIDIWSDREQLSLHLSQMLRMKAVREDSLIIAVTHLKMQSFRFLYIVYYVSNQLNSALLICP